MPSLLKKDHFGVFITQVILDNSKLWSQVRYRCLMMLPI